MKVGFIGAGKVGNSLGRYFLEHKIPLSGYFSRNIEHAKKAADHSDSVAFFSLKEFTKASDIIFITTCDSAILQVWNDVKKLDINRKTICHCSGAVSSEVFCGKEAIGAFGASVHPMQAVSSEDTDFTGTYFTLEGDMEAIKEIKSLMAGLDNPLAVIKAKDKIKYHGAAAFASNLVIALADISIKLLQECGFNGGSALEMLTPILKSNIESLCTKGPKEALTGPVERCDIETIEKHLAVLKGNEKRIYSLLSLELASIAREKNRDKNYKKMIEKLEEEDEKHSGNF